MRICKLLPHTCARSQSVRGPLAEAPPATALLPSKPAGRRFTAGAAKGLWGACGALMHHVRGRARAKA
eukprot:1149664-Prymnesium_polylepis.1